MAYTGNILNEDYWGKTGKTKSEMGFAAEGVINDNLNGSAMDAYAVRNREALARSEANNRANTAAQIQRAGFAGTPIGAGAANASEAAMLQNRFANNLDIEVQRQDMRRQGVNMAMDYANNANRFGFEQAQEGRAAELHNEVMSDKSLDNLYTSIAANPDVVALVNTANQPMASPEAKQSAITAIQNDQLMNQRLQSEWERRTGSKEPYTDDFAFEQVNKYDSTTNPRRIIENIAKQIFPNDPDMQKALVDGSIVQMLKSGGFTMMEDGTFELEADVEKSTYNSDRDNPWTSENAKSILANGGEENPEKYDTVIDDMAKSIKNGEYSLQKLNGLDDTTRNNLINALEGSGMVHTGAITYRRNPNGLTSTSGSPELNASYDNKTIIYWNGRPAYVSGRTTVGKGLLDGDKRYSYTITYLDGEGGTAIYGKSTQTGTLAKGGK